MVVGTCNSRTVILGPAWATHWVSVSNRLKKTNNPPTSLSQLLGRCCLDNSSIKPVFFPLRGLRHVCNYPNLCPWKLALWWEALKPRGSLKVDLDGQAHNWEMTHGSIHFSWKIFLEIVSKLSRVEIPKKARIDFSFPPGYTCFLEKTGLGEAELPWGTLQDDFL